MGRQMLLRLPPRIVATAVVRAWQVSQGPLRRLVSKTAGWISYLMLPEIVSPASDPMSGFFLCRRQVVANRVLRPAGYKILLEVLVRGCARKIKEVPFTFELHLHGQTKMISLHSFINSQ